MSGGLQPSGLEYRLMRDSGVAVALTENMALLETLELVAVMSIWRAPEYATRHA